MNNIQPQKTLLFSLSLLALSVLATKTFTSLTALLHFNRDLALADYFFTYITDMGIVVLLSIPAITIALLSQIFASFQFKKNIDFVTIQISLCKMGVEEPFSNKTSPNPSLIRRGTKQLLGFIFFEILFSLCKNILNIAVYLIAIALIALAIFYFVSAYTFYEWGGFVEYQHIEMAAHAEVDAEFFDLIFQWKTLVFTLAFVSLLFITSRIAPSFKQASLLKINKLWTKRSIV